MQLSQFHWIHLSSSAGSQGSVPDSEREGLSYTVKETFHPEQKHMETGEPTSVLFDVWRLDSSPSTVTTRVLWEGNQVPRYG